MKFSCRRDCSSGLDKNTTCHMDEMFLPYAAENQFCASEYLPQSMVGQGVLVEVVYSLEMLI